MTNQFGDSNDRRTLVGASDELAACLTSVPNLPVFADCWSETRRTHRHLRERSVAEAGTPKGLSGQSAFRAVDTRPVTFSDPVRRAATSIGMNIKITTIVTTTFTSGSC